MSEYDILLKPTRLDEKWFEVPKIMTCGTKKQQVKTWNDVIECAKAFDYILSNDKNILIKQMSNDNTIAIKKDNEVLINEVCLINLSYNKMVLFMLLIENKL